VPVTNDVVAVMSSRKPWPTNGWSMTAERTTNTMSEE
jgi:hypothetical protein